MIGILNGSNFVRENDIFKTETDEVDYLLDKVIEDCKKKCFHTYKYRCVYNIDLTNETNNENNFLNISLDCVQNRSEYYELNKENQVLQFT